MKRTLFCTKRASVFELSTKWTSLFFSSLLVVLETMVETSDADLATPIMSTV